MLLHVFFFSFQAQFSYPRFPSLQFWLYCITLLIIVMMFFFKMDDVTKMWFKKKWSFLLWISCFTSVTRLFLGIMECGSKSNCIAWILCADLVWGTQMFYSEELFFEALVSTFSRMVSRYILLKHINKL